MAGKNSKGTAKPRGKPFPKGVSGNPAGRKPDTPERKQERREALEIMRAAAPEAARLLAAWALDENLRADLRIRCAETVMDRVYGKSTQPIDGNIGAEIHVVIEGGEDFGG